MKALRSIRVNLLVGAGLIALVLACGGGSGACVVESPLGALYNYCHDDYTAAECSELSDSTHSNNSCTSLGFTKHCSDDQSNTYRMNCP